MNQLFVVGIGPGDYESMSIRAERILKNCQVIIGYTVYVELIQKFFPEAKFLTTPMRKEKERCELAFSQAEAGKMTALICSGDAGVYGMAGLVLSMAEMHPQTKITIVPGITAASSGAAVLGAPLMHDFAVISLSDLLTPWETIEARLRAAAEGDFVICLYNPASKKRADYLERACRLLLNYKPEDTVCGLARNVGREGESCQVLSLGELLNTPADMFTTVFIGSSQTKAVAANGEIRMETPRGYEKKRKTPETP